MREIKFRFFSKETERYLDESDYLVSGDGCIYCFSDLRYYSEVRELSDFIVAERFTGLKDRNGIRCYEGDIVQMYYQPMHEFGHKKATTTKFTPTGLNEYTATGDMLDIRSVIWTGGALMLHCKNGATGHKKSFNNLANPGESFEVIGNVHQNPELLEVA